MHMTLIVIRTDIIHKFIAVFIDFTKAFDLLNRATIIGKLEKIGRDNPLRVSINNILAHNEVRIQDGKTKFELIVESNSVLQGDPLSPLHFNVVISDITKIIQNAPSVRMYLYGNDIVIGSSNRRELQEIMDRLENFAMDNRLKLNCGKTVQMVFRKGGKVAEYDKITYKGEELNNVNTFRYLGITFQPTIKSFRGHIRERTLAAIRSIYDIEDPTRLSLSSTMTLFNAKTLPVIT
ncbi:hypothetical protein ANN_22711 [Periplaneta americana]|uniref:Reverse transcriptase domain-containing protein n=1 Tax=Periplaneta americana TaxID=6978 RepID=A0ABQ8S930_PERAM|nr:hypothetical protein ANN_22711 [Periplaneta americana]